MNIVETRDLSKHYGKNKALDKVSINVRQGEIYGLIGKNGAGKSTLMMALMDLIKPTAGEKSLFGQKSVEDLTHLHKNIGFMMTPHFFNYLSARQNLEYFRKLKGIGDKGEIDRVLELVDLKNVDKKFGSYSMGMKQRLNIANALMGSPDLIIMDEPINGLDPQGISGFREIVLKLSREHHITFIISSHILGELGLMATRFGFIHDGQLVEEIDADELKAKTQDQVVIKVDQPDKAVTILEDAFEGINYLVNNHNEIVIKGYTNQIDDLADLLVDSGLRIYKLSANEMTLEDYYLNLISQGGETHA